MTRVHPADRLWLDLEHAANPITICGVLEFDGAVTEDALHQLVRSRLLGPHPRFACRVARDGGSWRWVHEPDLDLRAHIHRVGLPNPGDDAALQRLAGQLLSTRLDPGRPLWQLHLVDRPDGRSALIARLHHAIADGISLARVLLSLADMAPEEAWAGDKASSSTSWARLLGGALSQFTDPAQLRRAFRFGQRSTSSVARLITQTADPDTPLRGALGPHKQVRWTPSRPLAEVKAIAAAAEATVNDVLLAVLAIALRRYLQGRGASVSSLRTFVPVNLRPLDQPLPRDLGNRFGLVMVPLPVGEASPADALRAVQAHMTRLKRSPEPVLTFTALQAMGAAPNLITHAAVQWFGRMASAITTNVPGPRQPITLAGATVESLVFWVPQAADVGLGISIFSYAGTLRVGIAADALRVPDPDALLACWDDAFTALQRAFA